MRIGPWRCADATWVSAVGLARRGVPTQSPRISVLLHLAIASSVEHGRCDAPGHSAKTSKVKNVSLDAKGVLVNVERSSANNRSETARGRHRLAHKLRRHRSVTCEFGQREMVKAPTREH